MKRKAPVALTGGGGFRYENAVSARFLLDLLAGTNSLGADFGRITRIDWQARDAGWLADDLALTCVHSSGDRCAGLSIKSDQQVTRGGFPAAFVEIAWAQWLGVGTQRPLREDRDAIVLVTGSLAQDVEGAWSTTFKEALQTTPDRMVERLTAPEDEERSQSSRVQRDLVASFACPEALRTPDNSDAVALMRLVRHVRLLSFDYQSPTSRDRGLALADCQRALRSGDAVQAEALWEHLNGIADGKRATGGTIDLAGLLAALGGLFDLRDHPDYRSDWEVLERHSREAMDDIRTSITGLPALARTSYHTTIQNRLETLGACTLAGESGCGKSALVKATAETQYRRVFWITDATLDHDNVSQCERSLSLRHPLIDILSTLPEPCLLVFDAVEKYSPRALRLAVRLIQGLQAAHNARGVRFLFTVQFDAADRIIRSLVELGVSPTLLKAEPVPRPTEADIQVLLAGLPEIQWTSLRPELRPLLTNLKILDWVVAAVRGGQAINDRAFMGLTALIDALWERWVEDGGRLDRSHLLMRLGTLEAATLGRGVPRMELATEHQGALAALVAADLVRLREERVRFSHDLLGDWARLRVLAGDGPLMSPDARARARLPRWHRAVRLYAQRLLEQSADGCEQWQRAIAQFENGAESDQLLRDLFLEAVFLATDAATLLERTWPALVAKGDQLLGRMLNRFMYVATLPDPRFGVLMGEADAALWGHLTRLPYWPYWGPLLTILHAHRGEVANLVPSIAARLCSLWLRSTPRELAGGQPMPWRREAAELALAIGRDIQALNAEGNYYSGGHDKHVYEAILWAAAELPAEVPQMCLELAERRDLPADIQARVAETRRRRAEERRQFLEQHPERKQPFVPAGAWLHGGDRRPPWPDGPRANVQICFQEACLDTGAFAELVRADPDAALEVLLAVCIEEPQYDDFGSNRYRRIGLEHWQAGDPPMFFRGPFLQFLRDAPEQGLSFVIKLTNFATRRHLDDTDHGLTLSIDGQARRWLGDSNVFRWHHDRSLFGGAIVECALMALERWLYEQIEQNNDVTPWVRRILAESESLALAGVLIDVGKRQPALFAHTLRPILSSWIICDWDLQLAGLRQSEPMGGYWGNQPQMIIQLAEQWYRLPHRVQPLAGIDGPVMQTMIGQEEFRTFFDELRASWSADIEAEGEADRLRLLIERFNPDNYTFELRYGVRVPVSFAWPEAIERQNAESLRALHDEVALTQLPFRARKRLGSIEPLPEAEAGALLQYLQRIDAERPPLPTPDDAPLLHLEDILCAGIGALVILNHDWLSAQPDRGDWCRRTLQRIVDNPPARLRFDSEMSPGDQRWDAFAAESGVFLLARNPSDALARKLVVAGIMSYHYSTTALTMRRACERRRELGDDFDRLLGLAVRWAGLRSPYHFSDRSAEGQEDVWRTRIAALAQGFIERTLPTEFPNFRAIDRAASTEIEAIRARQFPEMSRRRRNRTRRAGRSRESLHPQSLGLDPRVIMAAFGWLDLSTVRSDDERGKWLGFVHVFLAVVLELVPPIDDPLQQEIDGLPTDFDGWVWGLVSRAIPSVTSPEVSRALWQPILDLGTAAHDWVERFFWYWFSDGRSACAPGTFVTLWSEMIEHALASSQWDPASKRTYDLDDMVFGLLGFYSRMHAFGQRADYADLVGGLEPVFARAASKWFAMPKVMTGFLVFAVEPAGAKLLLPSIRWLAEIVPSFDSYDWKYGLEDHLITFLHTAWERHGEEIARTPALHTAFLTLLTTVVARGTHGAIALRDRVVNAAAA